nr:TniQ family protein [Streptomyces sp. NRRL S-813]
MHDILPPQPQPPRTAVARPGPVRLAPLQGETNLSYLDRLADRYRLGVRDLIPALLQVGGGLFKGYRTDGEVYLNAEARARISAFCRVPEEILQRALPAWTAYLARVLELMLAVVEGRARHRRRIGAQSPGSAVPEVLRHPRRAPVCTAPRRPMHLLCREQLRSAWAAAGSGWCAPGTGSR